MLNKSLENFNDAVGSWYKDMDFDQAASNFTLFEGMLFI